MNCLVIYFQSCFEFNFNFSGFWFIVEICFEMILATDATGSSIFFNTSECFMFKSPKLINLSSEQGFWVNKLFNHVASSFDFYYKSKQLLLREVSERFFRWKKFSWNLTIFSWELFTRTWIFKFQNNRFWYLLRVFISCSNTTRLREWRVQCTFFEKQFNEQEKFVANYWISSKSIKHYISRVRENPQKA